MFDATGGFVAAEFGLGGPSFTTTLTVHGSFICDGFYSDSGGPKFSTYTASPGIAQTGYISVRDSAGTTRRLLVG
jgi:hypothetical protein